ncbi:hypothetical protein BV372_30210 [Nostoc sp. T09]|uniref:hypothetical protein n=1 Tax=Nostoc sp. T09 TaxID=1932621 RepID=UPI000A3AC06A|nr:hypothetical protein [Nostoc sp. T09]OUL23130.1 hypothetical protein BV372_30210 [Nostoc sp. T09]
MKERLQIHKKADSSTSKLESSQLASHQSTDKAKLRSNTPLTQVEIENQEFQQHKIEATKLEIQAKYGSLTSEGQERLTVLQAKMNGFLQNRVEQESGFGHDFGKIATNRPQGTVDLIQPKLTISQPGDEYEQEADKVAATVVNQMNTASLQDQVLPARENSQATSEEVRKPQDLPQASQNSLADKKQKFLQDYQVANELVKGIDETLPQEKILEILFNNFEKIGFKYTMVSKSHENLLKGTKEGDCQTLARAFKKVAEEYFFIENINIESTAKPFLSEAGKTKYEGRGKEPNCDDGKRWFFQNHYWAVWNNKIYDVLFLSHKKAEADMARQVDPLKSMLMPEEEYYETEKGKVVYPYKNKYSTAELAMFEKLKNFVKNLSKWLTKDIGAIANKIQSLFIRGANTSEFDSLMRELQNNQINEAASRESE